MNDPHRNTPLSVLDGAAHNHAPVDETTAANVSEGNKVGDRPAPPTVPGRSEPEKAESPEKLGVKPVKLRHPLMIDGKSVTEIVLNFDKMSADDHINVEEEMTADGLAGVIKNAAFSSTYCLYIAARASGINIGDLRRLNFTDSGAVIKAAQNFMVASG